MYSKFYERFMLIGDFNAEDSEPCLSQFFFEMNAKNIVKEPTCYKSLSNPGCIDLVIAISPSGFQNTKAISTGFSQNGYNCFKINFSKIFPKRACL